jgi:hypothetical protein
MRLVEGPFRWVLFAGAVVLPYIAVIVANQANQRNRAGQPIQAGPPDPPQLTTGDDVEVISGRIVGDNEDPRRDKRVA